MSPSPLTILFTSAGRRVELLQCFRSDAARLNLPVRVVAADLHPTLSAACQSADACYAVPRCLDPSYVPALLEICRAQQVRLVVPTIDTELPALAEARERFEREGVRVAISSPDVVGLARDKFRTASVLEAAAVPVPRTARLPEFLRNADGWRWPVILKPVGGSSSKGIMVLREPGELGRLPEFAEPYLVQEWWPGAEYTVNIFIDRAGKLCAAVPHRRIETRTGEVSKGVTERLPVLLELARRVAGALPGAYGALCFQAIVTKAQEAVVFEINARFGGGYPLAHAAGARFSQWLLEEAAGLPSQPRDDWENGLTMLRYDAAVFTRTAP